MLIFDDGIFIYNKIVILLSRYLGYSIKYILIISRVISVPKMKTHIFVHAQSMHSAPSRT